MAHRAVVSPEHFEKAVARILLRADLTEGHENETNRSDENQQSGPLTPQELSELSVLCSAAQAVQEGAGPRDNTLTPTPSGFALVEADQLQGLMKLLNGHVNHAVAVSLIESAAPLAASGSPSQVAAALDKWLTLGEGSDKVAKLRAGLEAAAIVLHIVNTPGIDRSVINEEYINATITLVRSHISKHLVPAFNGTGHFTSASARSSRDGSPEKKRRRSSVGVNDSSTALSVGARDLRSVYKHIVGTVTLQLVLMSRLEDLVRSLSMDGREIVLIASSCLVTFEIDCDAAGAEARQSKLYSPQHLQTASIGVVTAAFRKYPAHRRTILEELYPLMLKLPVAKRSLRSFSVRYTSSPSKILESVNTKLVGPFVSNAAQPHCIQMITALMFALVHASVTPSKPIVPPSPDEGDNDAPATGYVSGLLACHDTTNAFVKEMLNRCKNKQNGGTEYRQLLSNIVDDSLLTVMIPEYPAAGIILPAIQQGLNRDLQQAKSAKNAQQQPLETTYVNFVFDLMGKMCATQARFLAAARERPLELSTEVSMSNSSEEERDVECYCQRKDNDVLLIQCDSCSKLYHARCVGFAVKENVPNEWFCDSCCLGKVTVRERESLPDTEAVYVDQNYAMHDLFLAAVASRVGSDDDVVKVHLCSWFDELERKWMSSKSNRRPTLVLTQLADRWDNPVPEAPTLSDEGGIRVILGLMVSTLPFLTNFKGQVGYILKLMSDESAHSLRKLSLKAIEKCVEGDQSLMLLPIVRSSVSDRIKDDSISVREAAVSLVGKYIAQCPQAIDSYQAALVPRLEDPGVSVRKRAIRIFQEILGDNPGFRGRAAVFDLMLRRSADPKEEDGVRDLIHEVFSVLWLRESAKSGNGSQQPSFIERSEHVSSGQGFVTPDTPAVHNIRQEPDLAAVQMVEVVQAAGTGSFLEALLTTLLAGGIDSDSERKQLERQKRQQLGLKQCVRLVDSLFEFLLDIEDKRNIREHAGKDLAASLATLAVFANVVPSPILNRVETVVLYLQGDNKVSNDDETSIVCAACDIIFRLSSTFDGQVISNLSRGTLAKDLSRISFTYGPVALTSAIRAFAALANRPVNSGESLFSKTLLGIAQKFYVFAAKSVAISDSSSKGMEVQKVHRALKALGLISEYREVSFDASAWKKEIQTDSTPRLIEDKLSWENFTLACYRLFWLYLLKDDLATKCKALSALKGIFVSQPQLLLMMDHIGLFDMVMSDGAGESLQLEALACWQSILEAEELRIDSGKAQSMMDSDGNITLSKRISGDQNGDATVFGGVLTNHAERVFEMTQSLSKTVRFATLRLVGLLLRQGLVNPNETVPHLFALQGDVENEAIRSMALSLLITEGEKRPQVLRQRIRPGIKQAYLFQRAIYPAKTEVSAVVSKNGNVESIFGKVFEDCIAKNQKHRLGLYKSLLSLFELEGLGGSKPSTHDLPMLSFAAQVLAHLPYATAVDPLFIIHHIDILYTSQGSQIMDRFADFLRVHSVYGDDEFEKDTEDVLEKAAKSKFPSRTAGARPLCSKDFPIATFLEYVRDGAVATLLLRLKKFLCVGYNLSVARCLEYDPNSKERLCDKGIPKVKFSEPFDASVATLVQADGTVDKDALIREYAEIRRYARSEGTVDNSTADSGDEPVTASRKRTKGESEQP